MQCDEYIKEIMKKQGALDGSTEGSIRAAFALIVTTPYITGDNFEGWTPSKQESKKHGKRDMADHASDKTGPMNVEKREQKISAEQVEEALEAAGEATVGVLQAADKAAMGAFVDELNDKDDKTAKLVKKDGEVKRVQASEMGPAFEQVRRVLDKHAKKDSKPEDLDLSEVDPEQLELMYEYLGVDHPEGLFKEAFETLSPTALQLALFKAADESSDEAKTFIVDFFEELVAALEGFLELGEDTKSTA